jgi:hypothetical protein
MALLLLAAMACAAVGYVAMAPKLSPGGMRAEHVICWALVLALANQRCR